MNYKRLTIIVAILLLTIFFAFAFFYERYEYKRAIDQIKQHGVVISNALWNLNPEMIEDYLNLACESHNYKQITVFDNKDKLIQIVWSEYNSWFEKFLVKINLISETTLGSDVYFNDKQIARIEAIWKSNAIFYELYILFALILIYFVCHLTIRIIRAKNLLEQKVKLRTRELSIVNFYLESEIEEHLKAREALRQSEEQYRIIIQNIPDIIYRADMDGTILFISGSCYAISGFTAEEATGCDIKELFYFKPEDRNTFLYALEKKGYLNNFEEQLKRKDGSIWWASTSSHFFKDSEGNIAGVEGISRDITSKKLLETELRQAQKMESIGTLTSGIAHDFNNILNIMLGNAELALVDMQEWDSAYPKIEAIKKAGLKASSIVKQLLNFSRKTAVELRQINVTPTVRDSIQLLRSTIPTTIKIVENIADIQDLIFGDPTQINQIIINLCVNASQAMEETGGTVEIGVEKVTVDLREYASINGYIAASELNLDSHHLELTREYIKISVSDDGPGIQPDIMDRIFDPYFTTKPVDKGTGMGLAVVLGIVKNHNGTISVQNRQPRGTTFNVLLPIVVQPSEVDKEANQETATDSFLGTERILIIDDDEFIVEMNNEMLERLGYRVESKTDPEEALKLFKSDPDNFDLIITDMTMPQMTGSKFAEKVKQIRADIPIVICSGYSSLIDEEKAKEAGIAAYLMKPVSMQELGQTIRNVLGKSLERVR